MGIPKRGLRCHFDEKSTPEAGPKRATLRPALHPALCRKDFGAVCDERSEKEYLSDLEHILLTINAMQCIGFGKRHAQDERINRLLLSLMTRERQANTRFQFQAELQQVVNRRSVRTGQNIASGKPFSCRGKEGRPAIRQHGPHRREPRALAPRLTEPAQLTPRGPEFGMTVQ